MLSLAPKVSGPVNHWLLILKDIKKIFNFNQIDTYITYLYIFSGVVNHQAIMFERVIRQFNNGTSAIVTPSRTIYLIGGPTRAQGDQHGAIRVNGKSQYIYVGDNVICTGNLDNCPQGFTMRFAMKPEGLINNMYFLDSFPLSIYYRDGKLFATARTPTKAWTVSAPGIRENEWQDIEITWHPQAGKIS